MDDDCEQRVNDDHFGETLLEQIKPAADAMAATDNGMAITQGPLGLRLR